MENIMANKQGMIFKFFDMWKKKRLNNFAKNMLKDNPDLEKSLKDMDDSYDNLIKKLKAQPDLTK